MFKCNQCIFFDEYGYRDMGAIIPECKLRMVAEQRKKSNNLDYDLFKSLIFDELEAENCKYFTFVSEAVDLIKESKDNV